MIRHHQIHPKNRLEKKRKTVFSPVGIEPATVLPPRTPQRIAPFGDLHPGSCSSPVTSIFLVINIYLFPEKCRPISACKAVSLLPVAYPHRRTGAPPRQFESNAAENRRVPMLFVRITIDFRGKQIYTFQRQEDEIPAVSETRRCSQATARVGSDVRLFGIGLGLGLCPHNRGEIETASSNTSINKIYSPFCSFNSKNKNSREGRVRNGKSETPLS